jgi:hypothetical protein
MEKEQKKGPVFQRPPNIIILPHGYYLCPYAHSLTFLEFSYGTSHLENPGSAVYYEDTKKE